MRKLKRQTNSKWITLFAFLFIILSLTQSVFAAERERSFRRGWGGRFGNEQSQRPGRVRLDRPTYGGNGCPNGTMRVAFAPDNLSFSILFDEFVAQVPDVDRRRRDRMICDAIIPIEIPANMQMEITRVDFRGFVALPDRGRAVVHSRFNFRNPRGGGRDGDRINIRYNFDGPIMEDYIISSDVSSGGRPAQTEVSPCGGQARLAVYNEVRINSRSREEASVSIDSIDGSSNAVYYVNWRSCNR